MDLDFYTYSDTLTVGFAIFHVVLAISLWKMAERTATEPRWFALVPFLNIVMLLKVAKRPTWWLILFIVPFVNIVALIAATMALCERFGINKWWGLVAIISPFNLVLYLYLAYGTEKEPEHPPIPPAPHA